MNITNLMKRKVLSGNKICVRGEYYDVSALLGATKYATVGIDDENFPEVIVFKGKKSIKVLPLEKKTTSQENLGYLAGTIAGAKVIMALDDGEQFIIASRVADKIHECITEENALGNIFDLMKSELNVRRGEQEGQHV